MRLRLLIERGEAKDADLNAIAERAIHMRPVMGVIQRMMQRGAMAMFTTRGSARGVYWPPSDPEWIERKREEGWPIETEVKTGDLRNALTLPGSGEFGEEIRQVTNTRSRYGTELYYAVFQEPKRPLLNITVREADVWAEWIVDYLLSGNLPE